MKTKLFPLLFFISTLVIIQGCAENDSVEKITNTIYVNMASNDTYEYDLGSFGDEEGASITKQASFFRISEIEQSMTDSKTNYIYLPKQDYVGTDEVEIKTARGSDGASANTDIAYVRILFTISK
jgi:hypothetical protein